MENNPTTIDMSDLIGSYDMKTIKKVQKEMNKRLKLAQENPTGCRITKNGVEKQ